MFLPFPTLARVYIIIRQSKSYIQWIPMHLNKINLPFLSLPAFLAKLIQQYFEILLNYMLSPKLIVEIVK